MTIRTAAGPLILDAGDFQFTHAGVTLGLKLSVTPGPNFPIAALVLAEKNGAAWDTKELLAFEFDKEVEEMGGVAKWIVDKLLPKLNAWLAKRFAADPVNPDPVPNWVPQIMVDLDSALLRLKVTIVDGTPQVTAP